MVDGEAREEGSEYNSPETLQLVAACSKGDAERLREFFGRFSKDIYNFPLRVFHLDEDAASDFYLYAFEKLRDGARFRSFQGRSSFRTWFFTVLRNLVIDWMRTVRELETVSLKPADDSGREGPAIENTPDPRARREEDLAEAAELTGRIRGLPMEQRAVVKLTYLYYLDLDEEELAFVATKADVPTGDVLQRVAALRSELVDKELRNLGNEDKITALYLQIVELKYRRERVADDVRAGAKQPFELDTVEKAIRKNTSSGTNSWRKRPADTSWSGRRTRRWPPCWPFPRGTFRCS